MTQVTGTDYVNNQERAEYMWHCVRTDDELNYSIYSKNNDYYGNLIVRREKSTTPEIGIDLIESMRNKGIAGRCIRLFADRFIQEHNDIDFLLFRVSSFNVQSIRMIEKLGAEKFEEEETMMNRVFDKLREYGHEDIVEKMAEEEKIDLEREKEVIYRYKLTRTML